MSKDQIWLVCSECRSRLAVERHHAGEVRCRNCSALLRAAKESSVAGGAKADAQPDGDDEEYRLAPAVDERAANSERDRFRGIVTSDAASELDALRARREALRQSGGIEAAPVPVRAPIPAAGPLFDNAQIRDDQRYKPGPLPRWTFFSGVFGYPWRPQSILPWVILSVGIMLWSALGLFIVAGVDSGSREGVVMAGFFGLGWIWISILTGSYASACVFAVTETTAYNFDAPYDWPEPDWRERFFHLLWIGWCLGLATAVMVTPSSLATSDFYDRALVIAVGVGILFPIFVLSTLETNSMSPLSGPVWRSLVNEFFAWVIFYLVSGAIVSGGIVGSWFLFGRLGLISAVAIGPILATCTLIYARLLGRLAWRIMRPGELQLKSWRKAHESMLAGEARRRLSEQEDAFEE